MSLNEDSVRVLGWDGTHVHARGQTGNHCHGGRAQYSPYNLSEYGWRESFKADTSGE